MSGCGRLYNVQLIKHNLFQRQASPTVRSEEGFLEASMLSRRTAVSAYGWFDYKFRQVRGEGHLAAVLLYLFIPRQSAL